MRKSIMKIAAVSMVFSLVMGITSYAGSWQQSFSGKWWKNDDGSYPTSGWQWIDDKNDGFASSYYFDEKGYVVTNTTTPDGYTVNEEGEWTVDGIVQSKKVEIKGSVSHVQDPDSKLLIGTMTSEGDRDWKYYLYVPENATENMPLIVTLHGEAMKAREFSRLKESGLENYLATGKMSGIPAYILIPHFDSSYAYGSKTEVFARMAQLVAKEFNLDTNRISIMGGSAGGAGTYKICADYPDLFSCGVPVVALSYEGLAPRYVEKLKNVPMWFINEDTAEAKHRGDNAVKGFENIGGQAWNTVVPNSSHGSAPDLLFEGGVDHYGFLSWMITQTAN